MAACAVCQSPDRSKLEQLGVAAMQEAPDPETGRPTSWRRASELGGVYPQSLKNHMVKHYAAAIEAEAEDELDKLIKEYELDLLTQAAAAPAEVKPLYLVAVKNLRGLMGTNASQQNLIQALKTIQDITGMKTQQAILLNFAKHSFAAPAAKEELSTPSPAIPELGAGEVVEAVLVDG